MLFLFLIMSVNSEVDEPRQPRCDYNQQCSLFGTQHTVVINAVYEAHSNLGMVVSHQDDVKQLLAVWVELPQPRVDIHQGLCERTDTEGQGVLSEHLQDKHYNIRTTVLNNTETICVQIKEILNASKSRLNIHPLYVLHTNEPS